MPQYKVVDGLQARADLNGHAVELRALVEKSGRHVVRTAEGELIKLKPQNLIAFADAAASDMRERGNAAFTSKRYHEAIEWYTAAAEREPCDSRPRANRAAAFLEVGDYEACEDDIEKALSLVKPDAEPKLWCRRAKAQAYAGKHAEALESFGKCEELDPFSAQLQVGLHDLVARGQMPECRCPLEPSELPSCRAVPSSACEFYTISNEDPKSALGGRFVEGKEQSDRVALTSSSRSIRIFFGGVGDGRHVLCTLLDLHRRLPSYAPPVELTLNDVKPQVLARDLLVLVLLQDLGSSLAGQATDAIEPGTPVALAALQLYFVYLGVFLPPEQHARLGATLHRLASSEAPPALVSCSKETWMVLRDVFHGWATSPLLTVSLVDSMYHVDPDRAASGQHMSMSRSELVEDYGAGSAAGAQVAAIEEERRGGFIEFIHQCDEATLMEFAHVPGTTAAEKRTAMLEMANSPEFAEIDRMSTHGDPRDLSAEYTREFFFWASSKLLPLPDEWRCAHGNESYGGADGVAYAQTHDRATKTQLARLRTNPGGWHPNATLVDVPYIGLECAGQPCPPQELYIDPFNTVRQLATGLGPLDGRSLFHSTISTFRPAALALADLSSRGQIRLSLEIGDAHAAVERVGESTPSLAFDRVYLSNVPDYTSMLNAFLYFVPVLRGGGSTSGDGEWPAVLEHELLLNTLLWTSLEQYIFSSTCLCPSDYWMLGVRLVSGDHMDQDGKPRWGLLDSGECKQRFIDAGRPTLESWLHRLLLACVLPPPRDARGRMRESCPLTLTTLFRAVERLKLRGCPTHWLIDFLNALLAGRLRMAAAPQAGSPSPLPACDPCLGRPPAKVDLGFCQLEARTLAAIWEARLRLPLTGAATANLLCKHTMRLIPSWLPMDRAGIVVAAPVVGLLIADPAVPHVATMLSQLEQLYASSGNTHASIRSSPRGTCHLLSVLHWDAATHEVSFYVPTKEISSFTASDSTWIALLIRTDSWTALTSRSAMAKDAAPAASTRIHELD